jgi:hypothetical protein
MKLVKVTRLREGKCFAERDEETQEYGIISSDTLNMKVQMKMKEEEVEERNKEKRR